MVGGVDACDPVLELCFLQRPSPDFAHARDPAGDQPQPITRPPVGERMAHRTHAGAAHHAPIDILDRTIEIDHRAWRFRDHQACLRFGRDRLGYQIDITILEPQLGFIAVAQRRKDVWGIAAARMRNRYEYRHAVTWHTPQGIGWPRDAGNGAALLGLSRPHRVCRGRIHPAMVGMPSRLGKPRFATCGHHPSLFGLLQSAARAHRRATVPQ